MTHQPLLPETTFAPLPQARLDAMIDHALTHRQFTRSAQVISFPRQLAYTGGMAAMAASILLAFMLTPQYTPSVASTGTDLAATLGDPSDLILLESFGA